MSGVLRLQRRRKNDLGGIGGYAKDTAPFAEFLWADHFRRHIDQRLLDEDFDKAAKQALKLTKLKSAGYLPGWSGPGD